MGYLSVKDEGNQFSKHVPHFRDFTRSSGTFSLKLFDRSSNTGHKTKFLMTYTKSTSELFLVISTLLEAAK